jgi:hypothetical protein
MKRVKNHRDRNRLPRSLVFGILFLGSFLPRTYGKASAALTGLMLAMYVLELMRGRKRYILAFILPALACIVVRYSSYGVYRVVTQDAARDAAAEKARTAAHYAGMFAGTVGRYGSRLWETGQVLWNAVLAFRAEPGLQSLAPLAAKAPFLIILASSIICIGVTAVRDTRGTRC